MKQIYDTVRECWIAATPEEIIRQTWVQKMVHSLGFPKHFLAIEKELKKLPHLQEKKSLLPNRRIDILSYCYHQNQSFYPLILLECKNSPLSTTILEQALAYNTWIGAYYIAVVNSHQMWFCSSHSKTYQELSSLPSFSHLIQDMI